MPTPTNQEFLQVIFGENWQWAHVTDFPFDPSDIPADEHLRAWAGNWVSRYPLRDGTNQYFTISLFYSQEGEDRGRRRKALYWQTPVIVLDDVREKLSMDEVLKLPAPSWILETSPGSEQWGYILDTPCMDRGRVENLLDGLVANGLAPDGKDPGMKGVTRYVRLPGGYNTKASKMVNGQPFKCVMKQWAPFNRVTIEQLAAPFAVNLDAVRREARVDGAAAVDDHPLLHIPDIIKIKEVRSDGRYDIQCPWVDEHTKGADDGAAVFTNGDTTIGFKCHHGSCQHRTGRHLLEHIERRVPGFGAELAGWKGIKQLQARFSGIEAPAPASDAGAAAVSFFSSDTVPVQSATQPVTGLEDLVAMLRRERPTTPEARHIAESILTAALELKTTEQLHWSEEVRHLMGWSKQDLKQVYKELKDNQHQVGQKSHVFYDSVMYAGALNAFFDWNKGIFYTADAFQNSFCDQDPEARKSALEGGMVQKVDLIDFAPGKPRVFVEDGITYGNSWSPLQIPRIEGDASPWLNHFNLLGWGGGIQKHMLQFMAHTILHPDIKINHMLLLGSGEGCGKDFLLYPLTRAMGKQSTTISGEELLDGFNDYLMNTKHLHINETELGDRKEAMAVAAKLKPLAAAPPDRLRVNQKGIKKIEVRNIINATMTTNSQMPLRLTGDSRRFFAIWSDMDPRDEESNMKPHWVKYWQDYWHWMKNGGAEVCIHYLMTKVDLSDFDPGKAPPVTDFLRDIQESSKHPAQQTVEAFINRRIGKFHADLLTSSDMAACLKVGEMLAPDVMDVQGQSFSAVTVGKIMANIRGTRCVRVHKGRSFMRIWIIRDLDKYEAMSAVELHDEYERQLKQANVNQGLTIVR